MGTPPAALGQEQSVQHAAAKAADLLLTGAPPGPSRPVARAAPQGDSEVFLVEESPSKRKALADFIGAPGAMTSVPGETPPKTPCAEAALETPSKTSVNAPGALAEPPQPKKPRTWTLRRDLPPGSEHLDYEDGASHERQMLGFLSQEPRLNPMAMLGH
eukprot:8138704-Pyramimonas_sp.AAC.1